jgi:DnaJ like chaperone protein
MLSRLFDRKKSDAVRGPIGIIIDSALEQATDAESEAFRHEGRLQAAFFVAAFALVAKMAAADGQVSLNEIETIDRFIKSELDCDPALCRFAVRVFNVAKESPVGFAQLGVQVRNLFGHDHHLCYEMLELLHRVALADGALSENEQRLLARAAKALGVPKRDAELIVHALQPGPQQAFALLRCDPCTKPEVLQQRYEALLRQYDPEAEAAHGMPHEFLRLTRKKRAEIEAAFRALQIKST